MAIVKKRYPKRLSSFGREVRKIRIDRGDTGEKMALKMGISPTYLSSIETGVRSLTPKMFNSALMALEIEPGSKEYMSLHAAFVTDMRSVLIQIPHSASELQRSLARKFPEVFLKMDDQDCLAIDQIFDEILGRG